MPISLVTNEDYMIMMGRYPDKFFDLALVDFEYGIDVGNMPYLNEMGTTVRQKNGNKLNGNRNKKPYTKKSWDKEPPPQKYFDELCRISHNQIAFGIEYVKWENVGSGRIRWDKGVAEGMSFKRYEIAYCSLIEDTFELPLLWAGMCQAKSLSEPMTQQGNKKLNEKRIHPTHKPILLYASLLNKFGTEGDKIIDTHLGGGSSRIAAYKLGYDFYACEIDKDYFDAQEKRFKEAIAQTLFDSPPEYKQSSLL